MLYKLTDQSGVTRPGEENALQWGAGITHRATGRGGLCSSGVLHAYESPELAAFMDPAHGCYGAGALLWEAEGEVTHCDGIKVGCVALTTLRLVELPTLTVEQRVEVAIRAVMAAGSAGSAWEDWAKAWLDGTDRSAAAAAAAEEAATRAVWAAERGRRRRRQRRRR